MLAKRILRTGDPFIWLSGGALALILLLLVGLFALIFANGMSFFWPKRVAEIHLVSGETMFGEIMERELDRSSVEAEIASLYRIQVKRGNRDVYGSDFVWVAESDIKEISYPQNLALLERVEWGNFYGVPKTLNDGESTLDGGTLSLWSRLQEEVKATKALTAEIRKIELDNIGVLSARQTALREDLRGLEIQGITSGTEVEEIRVEIEALDRSYVGFEDKIAELRNKMTKSLVLALPDGTTREVELQNVAHSYLPNQLNMVERLLVYGARIWEFVSGAPRESNTEGGVFPAIFGTVFMVILMSIIVTPLGVISAIYLKEYAKQGRFVTLVRIAVNNLAGVPSIVFGVFGVGFFIYFLGGSIDQLFFPERLPNPTFGTGGVLWASLTLSLLTLPTVIVATEEGLSAIPKHLREASYALGATKLETMCKVILPSLTPSILTGVILAVARAAGEVAPLMITGVVKLAPALPLDSTFPFLHLDRKFMHLGFHIYDVGFQAPNVDAARPMVYTTTLLLLLLVVILNSVAVILRNRLRARFAVSAV